MCVCVCVYVLRGWGCLGEVEVVAFPSYKDTKNTQRKDSGETTGGNKNKLMFSSARHFDVDINAARRWPEGGQRELGWEPAVPHMFHSKSRIVSSSFVVLPFSNLLNDAMR